VIAVDTSAVVAVVLGEVDAERFLGGDCFAYALAAIDGVPLLFRGDDYAQTDLRSYL
jgi:uncharacterized protein with PIN domain